MRNYPLTIVACLCLAACLWAVAPVLLDWKAEEPDTSLTVQQQRLVACRMHQMLADIELPVVSAPPVVVFQPVPKPAPVAREWRVPRWAVKGILRVETRSKLLPDDRVVYVDKRRGLAGERGPTQIKRVAFTQVAKPGEQFWKLEKDTEFALDVTERYLLWLRAQTRNWNEAVAAYNQGLGNAHSDDGREYAAKVRLAAALALAF